MGFLPKTMGTRPRLACEVRAEGVVAARAESSNGAPDVAERATFAADGNGGRSDKVAALRRVLDAVSQRGRELTLVVPDTAARVLLVDFDELPAKPAEAVPVIRFRLKKLLPFDADEAAVSYQVMAQTKAATQVLAVAMPRESLKEYEAMVREAGYEPGVVLPSTLAALAGLDASEPASLVVNAGRDAVTTAIVRNGVLLLHRTVDLSGGVAATTVAPGSGTAKPSETSREPAANPANATTPNGVSFDETSREAARDTSIAAIAARFAAMEGQTLPAPRAPEAPSISRVGSAPAGGMVSQGATSAQTAIAEPFSAATPLAPSPTGASSVIPTNEIAQAVNVAVAYFEDTLNVAPPVILSAGTLGAGALERLLGGAASPPVQEMVSVVGGSVPAGWLAGVRGALRS